MVIAFTGGRDRSLSKSEEGFLVAMVRGGEGCEYRVGDAWGVDWGVGCLLARELAGVCRDDCIFVADWDKHGKAAGPIRNGEMLDGADLLIAYPGGRGTADCIRQAEERGIPVMRRIL